MSAPTFDLQSHSVHSDGALHPADVVAAAADAGVELLALTDHDSVDGVEEAITAAEAQNLRLVQAVEITAIDHAQRDLHILGYRIDARDPVLRERLEGYRAQRENRAEEIIDAVQKLGFQVDDTAIQERRAEGKSIGRPHLADAVVRHPGNAERLAAEGLDGLSPFLEAYLIEDRPAFVPRRGPSVAQSIKTIKDAGGIAIWAHPFWDIPDPDEVIQTIDQFRSIGIEGVECFYPTHTSEQANLIADHCEAHGLLTTGSSDFHGPEHRLFATFRAFSTFGRTAVLGPIAD